MGYLHHTGYGHIQRDGVQYRAHRWIFSELTGEDITGKMLCHHCDNKACVNPAHMFVGTQADNMQDMYSKGRQPSRKGINNRTHLTEDMVLAIRGDSRPYKFISEDYGISEQQVSNIKTRISWSHI
jgi:hypothetical protein